MVTGCSCDAGSRYVDLDGSIFACSSKRKQWKVVRPASSCSRRRHIRSEFHRMVPLTIKSTWMDERVLGWSRARLEDESLVAGAAGGLFAVEVFEEGDGVFA